MKTYVRFALASVSVLAFDPGSPQWKKDADGKIEADSNGNPIYVDSSGKELSLGTDTVSRLNGEAKTNRERAEAAESKLKVFEGLDASEARKALDTVSKLDQKKLIDAGEVDKVREAVAKNFEERINASEKRATDTETKFNGMLMKSAFDDSKWVKDNISVPIDFLRSHFERNFKIENDQIVPYDASGNKIFSPKKAGETATFDEAIDVLVSAYPHKDMILKGGGHSGSGNNGNGGSGGSKRVVRRSDWDSMDAGQKATVAAEQRAGKVTISD